MEYKDLISTIKTYEGTYIEIMIDNNFNNKWFLMMIKEDLLKSEYQIKSLVNVFNFSELMNYTKSIDKKTIFFVHTLDDKDFNDKPIEINGKCTIIFLSEYINRINYNTYNISRLAYLSSLIISLISEKVQIQKSRYGTTNEQSFDISKPIRKLKLKVLESKIKNNII